jgi:hypothetical protein
MKKPSYTVRFDKLTAEGAFITELTAPGLASLETARKVCQNMQETLVRMGYRTAHDRIVGPAGEVYAVEVPS